jgi:hypothetical protein
MLFRTTRFRLFTCSIAIFFSGVDIQTAIRSQLRPRTEAERNCIPVKGTVNRSPDNRGSTVYARSITKMKMYKGECKRIN